MNPNDYSPQYTVAPDGQAYYSLPKAYNWQGVQPGSYVQIGGTLYEYKTGEGGGQGIGPGNVSGLKRVTNASSPNYELQFAQGYDASGLPSGTLTNQTQDVQRASAIGLQPIASDFGQGQQIPVGTQGAPQGGISQGLNAPIQGTPGQPTNPIQTSPVQNVPAQAQAIQSIAQSSSSQQQSAPLYQSPTPPTPPPQSAPYQISPYQGQSYQPVNLEQYFNEYTGHLTPSTQETQTRQDINNLNASWRQGILGVEGQPIAMPFVTGQSAAITRQADMQRQTLQEQLGLAQAQRMAAMDVAKAKYGFASDEATRRMQASEQDFSRWLSTQNLGLQANQFNEQQKQTAWENQFRLMGYSADEAYRMAQLKMEQDRLAQSTQQQSFSNQMAQQQFGLDQQRLQQDQSQFSASQSQQQQQFQAQQAEEAARRAQQQSQFEAQLKAEEAAKQGSSDILGSASTGYYTMQDGVMTPVPQKLPGGPYVESTSGRQVSTLDQINPNEFYVVPGSGKKITGKELLGQQATNQDTQITEVNGRKVLVDMQTGKIIKDLGSASEPLNYSPLPGSGRSI